MARPKPMEHGDQAHLAWGSIRWSIARQMRLAVDVGGTSYQYVALLNGMDVPLTADQVRGLVPPSKQPANLEAHTAWVLSGDDTLLPYKRRRRKA
jgi:hypothetical protein